MESMESRARKTESGVKLIRNASPLPYGSFEAVLDAVTTQLQTGPYILGDRFSAADVLWGGALQWMTMFGIVPEIPEIKAYVERTTTRPAALRVRERDAELAASHTA